MVEVVVAVNEGVLLDGGTLVEVGVVLANAFTVLEEAPYSSCLAPSPSKTHPQEMIIRIIKKDSLCMIRSKSRFSPVSKFIVDIFKLYYYCNQFISDWVYNNQGAIRYRSLRIKTTLVFHQGRFHLVMVNEYPPPYILSVQTNKKVKPPSYHILGRA